MSQIAEGHIFKDRYEVIGLIAKGGMAQVLRARDLFLNRDVALKVLYPELSSDPNFVERFRREARAAANLSHPNIVPVYDWGEEDGVYFIVMELVDGMSLANLIAEQQPVEPHMAASITSQVAAALGFAHRSGVVHRDVKPGNILLTEDGVVKVTDFGIAQAISTEDNLVTSGLVMGTATYFSPEQAEGLLVDGRSDVYSLGVVLFELLSGNPPFSSDSPVEVARMHIREVVPPLTGRHNPIPPDLVAITLKALAKNPKNRYQTAEEMRRDLLLFREGEIPQSSGDRRGIGDLTQSVAVLTGERTQAVAVQSGPRTDVLRRRRSSALPIAGSVALLTVVLAIASYFVLGSKSSTTMPNVVGLSIIEAKAALKPQGLVVSDTTLVESTMPAGTVISSSPRSGAKIRKGQFVRLRVSLGTTSQPVIIPDVTGMSVLEAETVLQSMGLSYEITFLPSLPLGLDPTTVLAQEPLAGTSGRTGDKVTISYLSPDANLAVPAIKNLSVTSASAVLRKYGLEVAPVQSQSCSNTVPEGQVVSSQPSEGSAVRAGSQIRIMISSGYCNVIVPNVMGLSDVDATVSLRQQGLIVNVLALAATDLECIDHLGQVIRQDPAGGATVSYGSTVNIEYCPPL